MRARPTADATTVPKRADLILFLICVAIAAAPLLLHGTSCGQDFDFHFESWMGASHQWLQGNLFPHWIGFANYGAGEPRFIFYPPIPWIIGGILGTFLPWTWASFLFDTLCLLAAGAACYHMTREWLPDSSAALAACFYIFNPYILFVVYERSALGELLAAAWFPLLILYALRKKPSALLLALTIAALWLTDDPAAVMGSYALALIIAIAAITQRRWTLIPRATAAMALGLGLSAVYLIPAVYEQRWVEIDRALDTGLRIQDSFLFEHTGMAYHDQVLRSVSWIAVILIAVTLISTLICWLQRKKSRTNLVSGPLAWPLILLSVAIIFSLFPISRVLWYALPKLHFLQFPWRWLLVLSLICALFAAEALSKLIDGVPLKRGFRLSRKILIPAIVLALGAILITHTWRSYWQYCDDEDNVHAQLDARDQGFEGTDEYTPRPADNGDIQVGLPPVRVLTAPDADQADSSVEPNPDWDPDKKSLIDAIVQIKRWNVEHMTAEIQSPQPGYAVLRLMDYPAWRITINGKTTLHHEQREDGLMTLPIPAGTSTIDVCYAITPDIWVGRIISLLSFILWLALAAKDRRKHLQYRVS